MPVEKEVSSAAASGVLKAQVAKVVLDPLVPPRHLLEISRINGSPWTNPAFDTSNPNWASNRLGGAGYDGSSAHPFEWVSVLNPTVEQDDEVAACGTALAPDVSGNDVPFVHPFGVTVVPGYTGDFEFAIALDPPYAPLLAAGNLAAANTSSSANFYHAWPAAQTLGLNPTGVLGMEVDAPLVPLVDRPVNGDRVAVFGRWIIDAGHQPFHTEIHPPLLMAYARTLDSHGNTVAPSIDAITHMQLWSRPYQAQQKFSSGDKTGLCLQDYVKAIAETIRGISAYPPIFAKAFDGICLLAFTVRPPVPPPVPSGPAGTVSAGLRRLECSYHFTVNGSCGVEVIPSPADANSALLVLALNSVGYPSLGEPPSQMKNMSIKQLLAEAEQDGAEISGLDKAFFWLKELQLSDNIAFRFFNAPHTSALDAVNVVPFTPLASLPSQTVSTDPKSPFPIRGWMKLAWVAPSTVATAGDGSVATAFDVTGAWAAGGKAGPKISRSGNALTVDMSAYKRPNALGSVIDPNTITVSFSDDATYTGHLQPPGTIAWSNGTSWTKV